MLVYAALTWTAHEFRSELASYFATIDGTKTCKRAVQAHYCVKATKASIGAADNQLHQRRFDCCMPQAREV